MAGGRVQARLPTLRGRRRAVARGERPGPEAQAWPVGERVRKNGIGAGGGAGVITVAAYPKPAQGSSARVDAQAAKSRACMEPTDPPPKKI